ncbi:hypothetical protein V8F06_005737 [Rhypophila decipiens]
MTTPSPPAPSTSNVNAINGNDNDNPDAIKIIIVGAGFAGLTAALELSRKGFSVLLLEKASIISQLGDIISFGQNSSRFFHNWPGIWDKLSPIIHKAEEVHYHDWTGKFVTTQSFKQEHAAWGPRVNGHRGEIHKILFDFAKEQKNIEILLGKNIVDYFETEDGEFAGVRTDQGEVLTADLVLAAEGVRSRGRKLVLGFEDKPLPSGYAVYRAWYPADKLLENPITKHLVENGDSHYAWIGRDVHFLSAAIHDGKQMSWVCTHKDEGDIEESWSFPGDYRDVATLLEGWDPVVTELVKATPEDRLFDYKLVFRDPLPRFVSLPVDGRGGGRTALIGDAAHPFLPTSIQGASQAMEDGVVLAACLDVVQVDKKRVKEAVKVWEKLRYDRVHEVQKTGVQTREQWHKADWEAIWKNPESMHLKREQWILDFDAEKDAYERYESVKKELGL